MALQAREKSFHVVSIEPNGDYGGYDMQLQVQLVPSRNAIAMAEQSLAVIAEQCHGHADGWGVRQRN